MKLFVIHPGNVMSRNDWKWHFIGATQLMVLYQVSPDECIIANDRMGPIDPCLHHLYPLSGPDYRPVSDTERELVMQCLRSRGLRYTDHYDGDRRKAK